MHVFVARHGRTNYNDLGLCNSDPTVNVFLTETGIEQSKELADNLKVATFERIYISELKRTRQTAEYVNKYHHVALEVDERLNDIRTGYEGLPASEYYEACIAAPDSWAARFNDGESLEDVKERVRSFLSDLQARPYNSVLIVTSEVIVQVMYGLKHRLTNQQAADTYVGHGTYIEIDV